MQVTYLLDQRLKWLIFHHVSREATAGVSTLGGTSEEQGLPAAVRAPLHIAAPTGGKADERASPA